jgi:integrase
MSTVSAAPSVDPKSKSRRSNGSGSVSLRPDGAFDIRVSLRDGRRRRKILRRVPGETMVQFRRRADAAAAQMQSEARKGLLVPSGHLTVKDYSELWLQRESEKTSAGRGLAPSTLGFYRQIFDLYVNPTLGSRPLPALLVEDVERMMTTLSRLGKSPRTVQAARNALGRLLGSARRDGLVA